MACGCLWNWSPCYAGARHASAGQTPEEVQEKDEVQENTKTKTEPLFVLGNNTLV